MLEAIGIEKSFGKVKVLKGIDLSIRQGEVVAIIGASGAGKSTLLHILGTLDLPDKGLVKINNENVFERGSDALANFRNRNIGFVFQFHNLLPEFSAIENVIIPGLLLGEKEKEVKIKAMKLFDTLGITDRANHKPSEMSGGEQQRTAVARALINSPNLVLADEPSGNLDSVNATELHKLIFQLRETLGQSFVIVTHNMDFATMADRTITIHDGRIV